MASPNERTNRIQVRLSDSMFERLKALSDDMGIPYSTLGTVALSEYVIRKEREGYTHQQAVEGALDNQKQFFAELLGKIADSSMEQDLIEKK